MENAACLSFSSFSKRYIDGIWSENVGREASRALGLMSLKVEDCTGNLDGLTQDQLNTLEGWEKRYKEKYPVVGTLSPT